MLLSRHLTTRVASKVAPASFVASRSLFNGNSEVIFERELAKVKAASEKAGVEFSPLQFNKLAKSNPELAPTFQKLRQVYRMYLDQVGEAEKAVREPIRVAITGASGNIGYAMAFRAASGEMFGKDQPVILHLLELPGAVESLKGVVMELDDCAFPLLKGVVQTSDPKLGFENVDAALLVGAKPRTKGMERADLLKENAAIFQIQGQALDKAASRDCRVVVVGNPANTNCLIAASNAPSLNPQNFTALMRLDHDRALAQVAAKTGCSVDEISRFAVWGNHSPTQYPDLSHALINGKSAKELIKDEKWIQNTFIPDVAQRGGTVIAQRGASSAASAANAAIAHMRDWFLGTNGEWTSMAVQSDGSYGVTKGLYYGFPVVCADGNYTIVQNVPVDPFSAKKMEATHKELQAERDAVKDFLQ